MLRLVVMPIVCGCVAVLGITSVLMAIDKTGWTKADMVRAVGSFFTKSEKNAFRVGAIIHFLNGIIIAGVYLHLLSILNPENLLAEIFVGGFMGFAQGFLVSWAIVRFSSLHPLKTFQEADYKVAMAHIAGHVVYGGLMGAMFGLMRLWGFDVSPGI